MANKKDYQAQALEMLKKADSKLLKNFITDKVKADETFSEELIAFLNRSLNKKPTVQEFEKLFAVDQKEIKETLEKSINQRTGCIDYKPRSPLNKLVIKSLAQIRSLAPTIELRIRCQLRILSLLMAEYIEPSGEAYDNMLGSIIEDLQQAYKNSGPEDKESIFKVCMDFLLKHESLGYEGEEVENFVLVSFDEDHRKQIKDYIQGRINALSSKSNSSINRERDLGIYLEIMLGLMYRDGAEETQLYDYAKDFWKISDVRKWFIWYYKESKQWDKAIKLAQESMGFDRSHSDLKELYKRTLKELYQITGQTQNYRDMLLSIIRDSDHAEVEAYRELKSLYSPEDWIECRDKIFFWYKDKPSIRAQYLLEEKLFDRLALLILSPQTDYYIFNEYASSLPRTYHNRVLSKYETHFSQLALRAISKKDYQHVLSTLKDAYKISGGKELTERLMARWLISFHNRPGFCDEIRKFRIQSRTTK